MLYVPLRPERHYFVVQLTLARIEKRVRILQQHAVVHAVRGVAHWHSAKNVVES